MIAFRSFCALARADQWLRVPAIELARGLRERRAEATLLKYRGNSRLLWGDAGAALPFCRDSTRLFRALGERDEGLAGALYDLACAILLSKAPPTTADEEPRRLLREALAIYAERRLTTEDASELGRRGLAREGVGGMRPVRSLVKRRPARP